MEFLDGDGRSTYEFASELIAVVRSLENPHQYIHQELLPAMDERRGRSGPATQSELIAKLASIDSQKPGELMELAEELEISEGELTPRVALEIADVVYYLEQLVRSRGGSLAGSKREKVEAEIADFLPRIGVTFEAAWRFCIVKYKTRLAYGDSANFHKIEEEVMERFLLKT